MSNLTVLESLKHCPDAFIDLLFECYPEVISRRLDLLQNLKSDSKIDNEIAQYIYYFVTGRLEKPGSDTKEYAVFQNVKTAIECAMAKKVVTCDKPKIDKHTLVTFSSFKSTTLSGENAIYNALHNNKAWTEEIQLSLSYQTNNKKIQERFCKIVCQLKDADIGCFRFQSLVNVMTEDVYAAVENRKVEHEAMEEVSDEFFRLIAPETPEYEDYQKFRHLCEKVREAIDKSKYHKKVRKRLCSIFTEYVWSIAGRIPPPKGTQIAERLSISSSTVHEDIKERLYPLVKKVQSNNFN